ncbi:hypothetical protein ACLOJK_016106 [Asimina triloba]
MELVFGSKDTSWVVFALPAFLGTKAFFCDSLFLISLLITILTLGLVTWIFSTGGIAWRNDRNRRGRVPIPGPRGLPVFGSLFALRRGLAHRTLAAMAWSRAETELMALSLGSTPVVVSSDPQTAKEILTSPHFADRPLKQSARNLMFSRAIGFAPSGTYWRLLRRIASSHLFAPRRILAHEAERQQECAAMLAAVAGEQAARGMVGLRKHLQIAALNSIMGCVFGRRYENDNNSEGEAREVQEMVREGFDLLGAFNFSDYLPWMSWLYDLNRIARRCEDLVPRVRRLVIGIIDEHKGRGSGKAVDGADFVDVLLGLEGEEKLDEDDMIAVLWVGQCVSFDF